MSAEDRKKLNQGSKLGNMKGANFNDKKGGQGGMGCC